MWYANKAKRQRKGIVPVTSKYRELPGAARQWRRDGELALELLLETFLYLFILHSYKGKRVDADGYPPLEG